MILDVDIGNTRLKWRLRDGDRLITRGHCEAGLAELRGVIVESSLLTRVRAANVSGKAVASELCRWSLESFSIAPEFAISQSEWGGVKSGYSQANNLGVDRWLALLAAWDLLGESCVVVDAGTALTVDVLVAKDRKYNDQTLVEHLGGYIVPGLTMMSDALYTRTDGVRPAPADLATLGPGGDTGAAVQRGCIAMAVALVERVRAQTASQARGASVPLVLTGGDADSLLPFIIEPVQSIPDLVLDGLAIALPGDNSL